LEELAEKRPARVVKLPRGPGEREHRWAHLLCGQEHAMAQAGKAGMASAFTDATSSSHAAAPATQVLDELTALKAEQARMAAELAELRALVQRMAGELGLS